MRSQGRPAIRVSDDDRLRMLRRKQADLESQLTTVLDQIRVLGLEILIKSKEESHGTHST